MGKSSGFKILYLVRRFYLFPETSIAMELIYHNSKYFFLSTIRLLFLLQFVKLKHFKFGR